MFLFFLERILAMTNNNKKISKFTWAIISFVPWGGGGSPRSNPYFRAKPKLSVFENGQFSGHFFFTKNVKKENVKCYGEKVLEIFLTLTKNFFSGHFFCKKVQKKFGKFFKGEKFFKIVFLLFFSKKVSWKKIFFECQNNFQNFFHITFYIFF